MKTKASISIIGIAVFLSLLFAVSAVDATVVRVEPASQTVSAGQSFNINIVVDEVTKLTTVGAILHFDPAAMQATAITEGITSEYPKFFIFEDINNITGEVVFTYSVDIGSSVSDSGPLVTTEFTADASASGTFNLNLAEVELCDEIGPIPIEGIYNGTVIIVGGPTPTPTPTPSPSPTEPSAGGGGGGRRTTPTPTPSFTPSPEITLTPIPMQGVTPTVSLPVTSSPTPSPSPSSTPAPEGPGFEAVFAIAGLLAVAYLTLRSKKKR